MRLPALLLALMAVGVEPGDEIICERNCHLIVAEGGAPAALAGVMMYQIDGDRAFGSDADDAEVRDGVAGVLEVDQRGPVVDAGRVDPAYRRDRRRLIETLRAGGVDDLAILHAFDAIPRHMFVPDAVIHRSYEDVALPLGHGQTISRPGAHALHLGLAELSGEETVLEIGTGSGYQTALLSQLAAHVYSVETVEELGDLADGRLRELAVENVTLRIGDGSGGWPAGSSSPAA